MYKVCSGVMGSVGEFSARAGLTAQDAAVASAAAAAAAMLLNEWSHRSVRTFMIIIFTIIRWQTVE